MFDVGVEPGESVINGVAPDRVAVEALAHSFVERLPLVAQIDGDFLPEQRVLLSGFVDLGGESAGLLGG